MSYYSRLAIATRGFRGGAGQSLYISQSFEIEDTDLVRAQVIEQNVDVASVLLPTLSIAVDTSSAVSVSIDTTQDISIDIETSTVSVST